MNILYQTWPWYLSGIIIGLIVPISLVFGNKPFGISSSLRHLCAACLPKKIPLFNYEWKKEVWNLFFVGGIILGAFFTVTFFKTSAPIQLSENTIHYFKNNHISDLSLLAPAEIFSWPALFTLKGFIAIVIGGFLVGFGSRYAGGCTSGHSISGISNLQLPSLIATVCFMLGGIFVTWVIWPILLNV